MVDPKGPMSAGRRGAFGVANSRGNSRPGRGGGWRRGLGVLLRPAGCPWRPDRREAVVGWQAEMDFGRDWPGQLPLPRGRWEHHDGGDQDGPCSPCSLLSDPQSSWGIGEGRQYTS